MNKLQWNFNRNSDIFFQENVLEIVVCEMAAILSLPQCVKVLISVPGLQMDMWLMNLVILSSDNGLLPMLAAQAMFYTELD